MRFVVVLLVCGIACAAQPAPQLLQQKLLNRLESIDEALEGILGVAAIDLTSGESFAYNGDVVFPQASSIKIAIMVEVFKAASQGRLKLSDSITLEPKDAVGGSGHLRLSLHRGSIQITIEDLVAAMMQTSDNTATNKLITLVGGVERVNRTIDGLGFRHTRLHRIMLDSEAARHDEENVSTPIEMARLMELIFRGKAVDEAASKQMLEIMKLVNGDFRDFVPATVPVASKPGSIPGVRCETGLVLLAGHPFALSVASTYLDTAENPVGEVARIVYNYFEKIRKSNRYGHIVRP